MSFTWKQPTRLVLLGLAVLSILAAPTQTAFAYQDPAKESPPTLKDQKPTRTAFTYQGQLKEGGVPANGTYTFRFALYSDQSGDQKPGVVIKDDVVVTNGSFSVQLDFGSDGLTSKESWLEVAVRSAHGADAYTALSPRQRLTPTPYAILAQAEPWSLIGVPVDFPRGVDTDLAPDKIADRSLTSDKIADGQVVKSVNAIKDHLTLVGGDNVTITPSGDKLTIDALDKSIWVKDGSTALLSGGIENIGIGTTKPRAKLDVAGDIHARDAVTVGNSVGLLSSSTVNFIQVDAPNNPLAIGFSNVFSVTPNPVPFANIRVGIGTTGPTTTLDVNGQARVRTLTPNSSLNDVIVANSSGVLFTRPASTLGGGSSWLLAGNTLTTGNEFLGTINNFPLRVFTNNIEKMRILTNGNVGIGTTTPTQRLTLASGNMLLPTANFGTDGNLYFGGVTDSGQVGMRLFGGLVNTSLPGGFIDVRVNPANLNDGLRFRVDANNGGAERMRITAFGNVGIATTNPTNTLDVNGQARIRGLNQIPLNTPFDVVVADGLGLLHRTPLSNLGGGNFWSLTGNAGTNPANNFLGTLDNQPLIFRTANTEKMRINSNGAVGIGTASPLSTLSVGAPGTALSQVYIEKQGNFPTRALSVGYSNNIGVFINPISGGGTALYANGVGHFRALAVGDTGQTTTFGYTPGNNNFHVVGTIRVEGMAPGPTNPTVCWDSNQILVLCGLSDSRLKTNVAQLTNVLDKLSAVRGVSFVWNDTAKSIGVSSERREIGVIAQEVEAAFPEVVITPAGGGYKTVDYSKLTAVLIEAVKELKAENEALKQRLEALEKALPKR